MKWTRSRRVRLGTAGLITSAAADHDRCLRRLYPFGNFLVVKMIGFHAGGSGVD